MHSLPFCKRKLLFFAMSRDGGFVRREPTGVCSLSAPDFRPREVSAALGLPQPAKCGKRDHAPFPATYDVDQMLHHRQEDINISILLVLYLTKAAALSSDDAAAE